MPVLNVPKLAMMMASDSDSVIFLISSLSDPSTPPCTKNTFRLLSTFSFIILYNISQCFSTNWYNNKVLPT